MTLRRRGASCTSAWVSVWTHAQPSGHGSESMASSMRSASTTGGGGGIGGFAATFACAAITPGAHLGRFGGPAAAGCGERSRDSSIETQPVLHQRENAGHFSSTSNGTSVGIGLCTSDLESVWRSVVNCGDVGEQLQKYFTHHSNQFGPTCSLASPKIEMNFFELYTRVCSVVKGL